MSQHNHNHNMSTCYDAIGPFVRLFNLVQSEYTTDSKISEDGAFQKYMLGRYYSFVHMARECVYNKKALRACKIIPLGDNDDYAGNGHPFWFQIEHTRFDGSKNTEKEICDYFWKSFGGLGLKLVSLGMSFDGIRNNINRIVKDEMRHAFKVRVKTDDVILSCKDVLGIKRPGWYGRTNWEKMNSKVYTRSKPSSTSRPKVTKEQYKNFVLKKFSRSIVETNVRYETVKVGSVKEITKSNDTKIDVKSNVTSEPKKKTGPFISYGTSRNPFPVVKKSFKVKGYSISNNNK